MRPGLKVRVLLETTAGQGSCLGCTFEELGRIIALVDDKARVGVCFDTCHVFASGYELRNRDDYERTIDALEKHVGTINVGAFHLNDSKKPCRSKAGAKIMDAVRKTISSARCFSTSGASAEPASRVTKGMRTCWRSSSFSIRSLRNSA